MFSVGACRRYEIDDRWGRRCEVVELTTSPVNDVLLFLSV